MFSTWQFAGLLKTRQKTPLIDQAKPIIRQFIGVTFPKTNPDAPCMDYLPTMKGEKWPHSRGKCI